MKNVSRTLLFSIAAMAVIIFTTSCEKDEEAKKPYYGDWESAVYLLVDYTTNDTIGYEKMTFSFTNTTFEDQISQGITADAVVPALTMGGDISNPSDNILDAEINIVTVGGAEIKKSIQPELFQSTFNAYLSDRLEESFEATYVIDEDQMVLTIPLKTPLGLQDVPLTLTKK